jgi:hypothetical protein
LREAHERAAGRISDHERDEKRPESHRHRGERSRQGETGAAGEENGPPPTRVTEDADQWIESASDEARNRKDQPDLDVGEAEVGPDQRPRGGASAANELVEQLDREEDRNDAGGSAPAPATTELRASP